jgi:microcystin-dependent protein
MSEAFIGQIMCTGFGFAPKNWMNCDGNTLPISQYQALFSLLGTTYGGNGVSTFMLPDLRGTVPVGGFNPAQGQSPFPVALGQTGGVETVTLDQTQNPAHTHALNADTGAGNAVFSVNGLFAATDPAKSYANPAPGQTVALGGGPASSVGGTAHTNIQPYLAINICLCLNGIYPTRP